MESIGLWYKLNKIDDLNPSLELHINLWNLYNENNMQDPFIDFGLGINNYKSIEELIMLIPFNFKISDIIDLYSSVKNPEVARLVFNEIGCEVESIDKLYVIKIDKERVRLFINIKDTDGLSNSILSIESEKNNYSSVNHPNYEILKFNFDDIKNDALFNDYNDIYIRFRIKTHEIKEKLFCRVDKENWYLESGFVKTQIVDIKVNKERNLPHNFCRQMSKLNYEFVGFNKIHLLVMSNSNDLVESFNNVHSDCRKLEEYGWEQYLIEPYKIKNVLAYHWKEKDDELIKAYGRLIKISSSDTNKKIIIVYILVVIILGAVGSGLYEFIVWIFNYILNKI